MNMIYGRNPVLEALAADAGVEKILIQKNIEGAGKKVYALAKKAGIPMQSVDKSVLDKAVGSGAHQGVVAYLAAYEYRSTEELLAIAASRNEKPFLVILDGIEDPHNLGAILRSADGAGAHGVIIPKRRAVSVTDTAVKASAGAAMHVAVARVGNLIQEIEKLRDAGLWIYGLDMDGQNYRQVRYSGAVALVVGGEGGGLSRLVREKCDALISLPMRGKITSLNASNAAAIALYEMSAQISE
ncbi:MAG: 23S rRNA (guanosine(2251)-2'-O)-methyltransferase RlmB [Clostridiales Family XIII bacterium]|nr:23S rRNA (guanosine(2251)-2'-O)-methyltransferase RlmB [Clostridiales Family XIII bacterium]